MRANKTNVEVPWSIKYQHHQAVIVATDVEHHPVIGQKTGRGEVTFDIVGRAPGCPVGLGEFGDYLLTLFNSV